MWICTLFIVGITVLPLRSILVAPVGAWIEPLRPIALIRPFWTKEFPRLDGSARVTDNQTGTLIQYSVRLGVTDHRREPGDDDPACQDGPSAPSISENLHFGLPHEPF